MKSHHIPLITFLSFLFFKATVLQAMPPVIEEGSVPKNERMPGKEIWTPDGGEFKSTDSVSSAEHEEYKGPNDSSSPYFSDHPQETQGQDNVMYNSIPDNHLARNTPPPFAPAETPSSPGAPAASHPSIVTTSDGRRIFQVPHQAHQETTEQAYGNFFSELDNQHTWKPAGEVTSSQEQFEEALSAIRGNGLFSYQRKNEEDETEEPQFIKKTFDGRAMIRMIATGEVNWDHLQNLSLKGYSLNELSNALAVALSDNIQALDEKMVEQPAGYTKRYKEALEIGICILTELIENKTLQVGERASEEEQGRLYKDYFFKTITILHEGFTCLEESREKYNSFSRDILLCKGMALIKVTEEKLKKDSRPNIMQGFNEVLELFEKAGRVDAAGRINEATYLNGQAFALYEATREEVQPEPRPNIVQEFKAAFALFEKAGRVYAEWRISETTYLNNQAFALLEATREEAQPEPRPNIVQEFKAAFALFEKAGRVYAAGRINEATYLNNQACALLGATREEVQPEPRPNIVQGFREAFALSERAVTARAVGRFSEAAYLNNQGRALLGATREEAQPEPRPNIVQGFREAFALFERAVTAEREGRLNEGVCLNNQGVALL